MTPHRAHFSAAVPFGSEDLEDLYEHAPCGYLSLELGGRVDRVNATFLTWSGYSSEELLGRPFQSLLNIAGKIYYETHFAPLLRLQGFFNEVALDLVAKDGEPIPVLVNATVRRDVNGEATFIRITVFNARDRRLYERELLATRNALATANRKLQDLNDEVGATNQRLDRANRELRAFYETLPVGIFRADETGQVVQASRRFCALLGIETAKDWFAAIASEDQSSALQQWQRAIREGNPFSQRFLVSAGVGDQAARHIEMKAVPIPGSGGVTSAFVGLVEDVTQQLRVESRKRESERDAAIRQLTGGFAHNLNGILTVILGTLEMLHEGLADRPQVHPILDRGLIATQRAAALVRRLLVFSGFTFTRPASLDVDTYLGDISKQLDVGQPHRLTCEFRARGGVVQLEADMLREALEELISNAIAAMPEGGEICLSTRVAMRGDSGNPSEVIIIAVSDHGTGMDQATLSKAREPFFTRRDVGQGMGLGLSLVDGIARIAGGELRLQSDIGKGTSAELHLPTETKGLVPQLARPGSIGQH